jgi:hypothetical protein
MRDNSAFLITEQGLNVVRNGTENTRKVVGVDEIVLLTGDEDVKLFITNVMRLETALKWQK